MIFERNGTIFTLFTTATVTGCDKDVNIVLEAVTVWSLIRYILNTG